VRESAEISPQALRLFFYLQFCFVLDDDEDNEKYEEDQTCADCESVPKRVGKHV
jgi:hypothetical protein